MATSVDARNYLMARAHKLEAEALEGATPQSIKTQSYFEHMFDIPCELLKLRKKSVLF